MKDIEELSIDILGCHRVLAMAQEDNNYSNAFFKKAWETVNHEKQLVKK